MTFCPPRSKPGGSHQLVTEADAELVDEVVDEAVTDETSERKTRELPTICTFSNVLGDGDDDDDDDDDDEDDESADGSAAEVFTATTVSEPCGKIAVHGKWIAA